MLNSSLTDEDAERLIDIEGIWRLRTKVEMNIGYYKDFITIVKFESACNTPRLSSLIDGRPTVSADWTYSGNYFYYNPSFIDIL